jgi:hypothetical protein
MSSLNNFAESGIANHLFRTTSFAKPLTIAVGLSSISPDDLNITELPNANAYARVDLGPPLDALFSQISQQANGSGVIYNESVITFPTCTSTWGWVSGLFLSNSGVYNAGNFLMQGPLTVAKFVTTNDTFSIPRSGLAIYFA